MHHQPQRACGDLVVLPGPSPRGWVSAAGTVPVHSESHDRVGDREKTLAHRHEPC